MAATLLLPQDRIAREPLTGWAARLERELDGCRGGVRTTRGWARGVSGVANNAALIAAHHGDPGRAAELCRGHMRWQARLGRRSGDAAVAGHALQPWINLARLEALAGSWEAAIARLGVLERASPGRAIELGDARLPSAGWRVLGETTEDATRFVERVMVVESLKALLANRRYDEILAFAPRRVLRPALARMVAEGVVVAAAGAGDLERARHTATGELREARGWERVVFQLRLAEVLCCAGALEQSCDLLRPLFSAAAGLSPATRAELQPLYVLARIATAAAEAGLDSEACQLAVLVLEGALTARDEVFQLQALRTLSSRAPPRERGGWREALARLEDATEYRRESRRAAATLGAAFAALDARLTGILAA